MENARTQTVRSIAAGGAENPDAPSIELARLIAELLRAGWRITLQIVPNEWGAVAEAEILFERVRESAPPRTLQQDMEALTNGLVPQAPVHWKFDPFTPLSLCQALKRFHTLFVPTQDAS